MAKRKPKLRETYTDADGIERDTRTRRRVIRVGTRAAHVREGDGGPLGKRISRLPVIEVLKAHQRWDREDKARNDALAKAADVLATHWHLAGLTANPKTPNIMGVGAGTGDPAYMMPTQEAAVRHRDTIRMAREMIGPRCWPCVEAVVCEDRDLEDAGRMLAGYQSRAQAIAVALERVIHGVEIIAVEWGHVRY